MPLTAATTVERCPRSQRSNHTPPRGSILAQCQGRMKAMGDEPNAGARQKGEVAEQTEMAPEARRQPENEATSSSDNDLRPQPTSGQERRNPGEAAGPQPQSRPRQKARYKETKYLESEPLMLKEASISHVFNELDPKGVGIWVLTVLPGIPEDPMEEFHASPAGRDTLVPEPGCAVGRGWKGKWKGKAAVPAPKMPARHIPGAIREYPHLETYLASPAGKDMIVLQRSRPRTAPPIERPKDPGLLKAKKSGKPHHLMLKYKGLGPPPGLLPPAPRPRRGSLRWFKRKLQRSPPPLEPPTTTVSYHQLAFPANRPSTVSSVGSSLSLAWSSSSDSNHGRRGKPKLTIDATAARLRRAQRLLSRSQSHEAPASGTG